jgi:membrane protease YdiL (CAAX protease family)
MGGATPGLSTAGPAREQRMDQTIAVAGVPARTDRAPWGLWSSLAWLGLALVLNDRFPWFEHALLDGTGLGRIITHSLALGALNSALAWSVPLLVLIAAVGLRGQRIAAYFGWSAPTARAAALAIALGLALQLATYALPYFAGADLTSAAVAQYRQAVAAGQPPWWPLLLDWWPSFVCAPIVEESVFRGFLWRGWAASPLGPAGTWLLSSVVFAAWHVPKALKMGVLNGSIMLVEVLVLGLVLGWLRWRSRSTTPGMIAHATFNVIPPAFNFTVGVMLAGG